MMITDESVCEAIHSFIRINMKLIIQFLRNKKIDIRYLKDRYFQFTQTNL